MTTFIDINTLRFVPPCNLNRDDTGVPKNALIGGSRRLRISSQATKKAIRDYCIDEYGANDYGTRTVCMYDVIANEIKKINQNITDAQAIDLADEALDAAGINSKHRDKTERKVDFAFFIGNATVQELAQELVKPINDPSYGNDMKKRPSKRKKTLRNIILNDAHRANDIALFGRMLADDPALNIDGAVQFAHQFGVSRMQIGYDYFTASDDSESRKDAGAPYIGTTEFASDVMYSHANINVDEVIRNQNGDVAHAHEAIRQFLDGVVNAMPSGKQHSFDAHTPISVLVVSVHNTGMPRNYAGAFEKPIDSDSGVIDKATERLFEYINHVDSMVGTDGWITFVAGIELPDNASDDDRRVTNINGVIDGVMNTI